MCMGLPALFFGKNGSLVCACKSVCSLACPCQVLVYVTRPCSRKAALPQPLIPLGSLGGRQRRGNGHGPHPAGGGFTFDLLSPGRPRSAVPQVMGSPPGSRAGALRTLPPGEPAPFRVEARARSLLPEARLAYPSGGLRRAVPPPLSCRHTLRFWNAAFFDAVHCERRKRSPTTR